MRFRVAWLGLLLWGCNTATPVPDWTPPRAQTLPEKQSSTQLAETQSHSLPVKATPTPAPRERRPLTIGQAPVAVRPQTTVPQSEPGSSYPRYQARQPAPAVTLPLPGYQGAAADPGVEFATVNIDRFLGLSSKTSCAVVLLVDVSGSVFQQGVEVAVDAAAKIYARQAVSDRVWVVAFGSQAEMVVNGHGGALSREQLGRALTESRPANSGTFLAPAIEMAASTLRNSTQARRVVVISDGMLGDAELAVWQAAHAWNEREISFSTVHIGGNWSGEAVLQEIAGQTRGSFVSSR